VWSFGEQSLAPAGAAAEPSHVGLGPGLVDKEKSTRIDASTLKDPLVTMLRNVRAVLLGGVERLFLKDNPS